MTALRNPRSVETVQHAWCPAFALYVRTLGLASLAMTGWVSTATPSYAQPAARTDLERLANGYAALAAGRTEEAIALSEQVLKRVPRHHAAITLNVLAASRLGHVAGLEAYERWMSSDGPEDPYALEPVAVAVVTSLARQDIAEAQRLLEQLNDTATVSDQHSRADDRGRELTSQLMQEDAPNKALLLRALARAGYRPAAPEIIALLGSEVPDVRAAAAETLGALGSTEAIPALQAQLEDPASEVRAAAAVALHRLGDSSGDPLLRRLLASGMPDLQLQAIEGMVNDPPADWVPYLEPLLSSDAPMTRLTAARLLLPVDPERARNVLGGLIQEPNPVVAGELATALADGGIHDLPTIRRLLRQSHPAPRLQGAKALLRITGAL